MIHSCAIGGMPLNISTVLFVGRLCNLQCYFFGSRIVNWILFSSSIVNLIFGCWLFKYSKKSFLYCRHITKVSSIFQLFVVFIIKCLLFMIFLQEIDCAILYSVLSFTLEDLSGLRFRIANKQIMIENFIYNIHGNTSEIIFKKNQK